MTAKQINMYVVKVATWVAAIDLLALVVIFVIDAAQRA
jgi:hypothetical protein